MSIDTTERPMPAAFILPPHDTADARRRKERRRRVQLGIAACTFVVGLAVLLAPLVLMILDAEITPERFIAVIAGVLATSGGGIFSYWRHRDGMAPDLHGLVYDFLQEQNKVLTVMRENTNLLAEVATEMREGAREMRECNAALIAAVLTLTEEIRADRITRSA